MLIIHLYNQSDAAGLESCVIERQDFERELAPNRRDGKSIASRSREHLLERCERECGAIYLAEENGAVAGFVAVFAKVNSGSLLEQDSEYAYVSDLIVLPQFVWLGVATALMERAESFAREKQARVPAVDVIAANAAARELYRSAGFQDSYVHLVKQIAK